MFYKGSFKRQRDKKSRERKGSLGPNHKSLLKSHRTRLISDMKLDLLSQTLNVRKK